MSFSLDVSSFAEQFEDGAEKAVRGTTIELWSSIIKSSPVDEGRFRGNWFPTGQKPSEKVDLNNFDKSGSKSSARATQHVSSLKDWSTFTLTNNLPYSEIIEFGGYGDGDKTVNGFSKQAPQGVVRVNVARFNTLLEQQARKSLPK